MERASLARPTLSGVHHRAVATADKLCSVWVTRGVGGLETWSTAPSPNCAQRPRGSRRAQRWEGSRPRDPPFPKPRPSLIKGGNTSLAPRTPSRRAGIQLRRAQPQMAVRPQATSDRQRVLPVRGSSAAYVDAPASAAFEMLSEPTCASLVPCVPLVLFQ